jgi:hypothetical protein
MRIPLSTIPGARDELSESTVKTRGLVHAAIVGNSEKPPRCSGELSKVGKADHTGIPY